jgi:hypothetical protein
MTVILCCVVRFQNLQSISAKTIFSLHEQLSGLYSPTFGLHLQQVLLNLQQFSSIFIFFFCLNFKKKNFATLQLPIRFSCTLLQTWCLSALNLAWCIWIVQEICTSPLSINIHYFSGLPLHFQSQYNRWHIPQITGRLTTIYSLWSSSLFKLKILF